MIHKPLYKQNEAAKQGRYYMARIPDFLLPGGRSQRVLIQIPIRVRGEDVGGRAFDEETETQAINARGAFILLQGRVSRGAHITLKHNRTGEEQECRVLHLGPLRGNKAEIGLETKVGGP